ncbi:MAG: Crp/Fnr family transcriptional regulator [Gammaproteobacteria bacterium]|nr:Crp/Fnr family transcriptional regulator [Gammaproteobacteria bacterium]
MNSVNSPSSINAIDPSWLAGFPGLAGIRDETGLAALRSATVYEFPAGAPLMRHGDPCESFILMARGTARVFHSGEGGREILLFRVRAGELCVLTLSDLIASRPYSANAVAEEAVEAVIIPAPKFHEALAKSEAFRTYVLSSLALRLREVMGLVEQIAFQRLDLRLACLLGKLFGQRKTASIHITHQELANELGTSREVASRLLKEFENMQCIRLKRGEIELLSSETLDRLSRPEPS